MIEKLLEGWLDSASERSYQATFVQILNAQGHQVVHSTRHCALEFGKDVISIAPDGIPCAYQLKGKPSGQIGLREFVDEMQAQLIQLISQPIVFPGLSTTCPHRSYLVTNGYFAEEVVRAIDDLNRGWYPSKVELITRGHLLSAITDFGVAVWPSELKDIRALLDVFVHDGHDLLPVARLAPLLQQVLSLRSDTAPLKRAGLERAVASSALLTGVATHHFAKAENHYAVASAWCLFAVSAISAYERSDVSISATAKRSIRLAELAITDALVALWDEAQLNLHLVQGNPLADGELFSWRYTLLCGLWSALWFSPAAGGTHDARRTNISSWLSRPHEHLDIWGEAAMPHYFALLLFLKHSGDAQRFAVDCEFLAQHVLNVNQRRSNQALPDPYYSFADVARSIYDIPESKQSLALAQETFAGSSFISELLLRLLATEDQKESCQRIWPNFSRIAHKHFVPDSPWMYGTYHCEDGELTSRQYSAEYQWQDLMAEAKAPKLDYIPKELASRPLLLLLWTFVVPSRLTPDVGIHLNATLPTL